MYKDQVENGCLYRDKKYTLTLKSGPNGKLLVIYVLIMSSI